MTRWEKYGLWTAVAAGLAVGGKLWFEGGAPVVKGEDMAVCQAAYNGLRAAYLFGHDRPGRMCWTNVVTNAVLTAAVAEDAAVTITSTNRWTVTRETLGETRSFLVTATAGAAPDFWIADNYTLGVEGQAGLNHSRRFYVYNEGGRTNNGVVSCDALTLAQGGFESCPESGCLVTPGSMAVTWAYTGAVETVAWTVVTNEVEIWSWCTGDDRVGPYMLWTNLWNVMSGLKRMAAGESGIYWLTDVAVFDEASASGHGTLVEYSRAWTNEALAAESPGPGYAVPTNVAAWAPATGAVDFVAHFRVTGSVVSNAWTAAGLKYEGTAPYVGAALWTNVAGYGWWGSLPEVGAVAGHASEAWLKVEEADVPYGAQGNWWTATGLHTNRPWVWLSAEWYRSNGAEVVYNRWLSTNKLDAIRTAATNMVRTVCALGPAHVALATESFEEWNASTPFDGEYETAAAAFAARETEGTNWTRAVTNGYPSVAGGIARASAHVEVSELDAEYEATVTGYTGACAGYNGVYPGTGVHTAEANYVGYGYRRAFEGVLLDYPAYWAVTNGLVKRVRVFGVFGVAPTASLGARTGPDFETDYSGVGGQNYDLSDWYETWAESSARTLDQTEPGDFVARVFGSGVTACGMQAVPAGWRHATDERWVWQEAGGGIGEYPLATVVVSLLHDTGTGGPVTSLEALRFDFGVTNNAPFDPSVEGWQSTGYVLTSEEGRSNYHLDVDESDPAYTPYVCDTTGLYDGVLSEESAETETYTYEAVEHTLWFEKFVVVVDWVGEF